MESKIPLPDDSVSTNFNKILFYNLLEKVLISQFIFYFVSWHKFNGLFYFKYLIANKYLPCCGIINK